MSMMTKWTVKVTGYMWVPADSGPSDDGDDLEMEDDFPRSKQ